MLVLSDTSASLFMVSGASENSQQQGHFPQVKMTVERRLYLFVISKRT